MSDKPITIIGLVGKKQSGKDTTCKLLREMCVYRCVIRLSYGDFMKLELGYKMFSSYIPKTILHTLAVEQAMLQEIDYLKQTVPEFRKLLQDYYQRMLIEHGENYWDDMLAKAYAELVCMIPTIVVVTDVRYPKQAAWINSQGGVLWRIRRPDVDEKNTDTHSSETELESISPDRIFYNTGDIKNYAGSLYLSIRHFKLTFGQNIKHYEDIDYTKL